MKIRYRRVLVGAVLCCLSLAAFPATAQISPAQIKAQRDRAVQAAAAKDRATREKAAAAARAAAAAKTREIEGRRRQIAEKAAVKLARKQAVIDNKINRLWLLGDWTTGEKCDDPNGEWIPGSEHFAKDGAWGAEEVSGFWSISGQVLSIITNRSVYDGPISSVTDLITIDSFSENAFSGSVKRVSADADKPSFGRIDYLRCD